MVSATLVVFTSNLAQAVGAVFLAIVLLGFHRLYERPYLRTWAWSWWAFSVSLVSGSVALYLVPYMPPAAPARLATSSLALVAGYWQMAWLLFGTYEVLRDRSVPRRPRQMILTFLLLLGVASVALSLSLAPHARFLVRVGVRSFLLGVAFLIAGWGIWRSHGHSRGFGRQLLAGALLLFGAHQIHYVAIAIAQLFTVRAMAYSAYLGSFDFLFQALVAIGMVVWLLEDERRRAIAVSQRIEHLAYHDLLTDLPNRHLLVRYLKEAIVRAEARRERLAVLYLDLDRFKVVNDSLGNAGGDELLKSFAERLRKRLRSTDLIARLAADEFAILLPAVESEETILRVAQKVLEVTRLPFTLQGQEIFLTASVGIGRCPEDGTDAELLLKRAEIAMVRVKGTNRDAFQFYAPSMDSNSLEQLSLEADLRKALTREHGELVLFYQPVLDSRRRCVDGVEALLRWHHPTRGLMAPGEFLWLAEVSGLASVLDLWVLRTACREVQEWRSRGSLDLQLAVNLSPRSFQQPELLDQIRGALAEAGLPPALLVLEITETLAMQNAENTLAVLGGLKELGVKIAIDDFGTGFSSLSYLTTFPVDTLKVDRSFVHTLGLGRGGEEVAAAVIALALSLEISVVAEGVEEEKQWRWLEGLGCERFQGYYFSPPLAAAECQDLLLGRGLETRFAVLEQLATSA
jgi:diguanylate cyclase (GGDEF)-like protein